MKNREHVSCDARKNHVSYVEEWLCVFLDPVCMGGSVLYCFVIYIYQLLRGVVKVLSHIKNLGEVKYNL